MRGAAVTGSLVLLPLATACGAGDGESEAEDRKRPAVTSVTAAPEAGVVAPAKVEVIAALTGCEPRIRFSARELREGVCRTREGDYVITTFPEERLKETWLDAAGGYGGTYLVGSRWVVGARPEMLERFRPRLGGTVRQLRGMGPVPAPSAS
ncbi:hypothetical protein [Streptomyces sp. NPDC006739]|uniref:hypothetical protein n=1 Tax=Streptomyces sp. NPDC006739 TaxID=3364763 RepID=UPI0036853E77